MVSPLWYSELEFLHCTLLFAYFPLINVSLPVRSLIPIKFLNLSPLLLYMLLPHLSHAVSFIITSCSCLCFPLFLDSLLKMLTWMINLVINLSIIACSSRATLTIVLHFLPSILHQLHRLRSALLRENGMTSC